MTASAQRLKARKREKEKRNQINNEKKLKKLEKEKLKSKDPRPTWSSKKYKTYGEFREAVKAWRIRNGYAKAPEPKEKRKYVGPRERKFGKDKKKENLKIEKQVDEYVKKMKGDKPIRKVDYPSKTVEKPKNVSNEKNKKDNKKEVVNKPYVDPDAADKKAEKVFRSSSSVKQAKEKHAKAEKLKIGYRRTKGEGIDRKGGDGYRGDTRITAKLKKAGFTESRLARLRKKHAEWKAKRKKKKKS